MLTITTILNDRIPRSIHRSFVLKLTKKNKVCGGEITVFLFQNDPMVTSNPVKIDIISGVVGFAIGFLSLLLIVRWHRREAKKPNSYSWTSNTDNLESLHWNSLEERRGLGDLLRKVNHIAITVSDVGKSLSFYVDILGLQQIRRPTFDRHGAWLTMGNIELHLIKGIPAIPPVDNLQVAHIALETSNVKKVVSKLRQLNIEVRQSLNVTNAQKPQSEIIQYFFTDPAGYYLELCNCDVLTKFAFSNDQSMDHIEYYEGISNETKYDIAQVVSHWKEKVEKHRAEQLDEILQKITRATEIDENKFQNLVKRRILFMVILYKDVQMKILKKLYLNQIILFH
jgi:catechol 2,3-dioxygenase-like lactoylglutathione lyase family enzyme